MRRWLKWVVALVLLLPLLFWLGVGVALKLTQLQDYPMGEILTITGRFMVSGVECAVLGCDPELLEGMETTVFDEILLQGTPVALDVDEQGRVLVAETSRQNQGAEDNRDHPYWLEDDLASRTVDDRRAYYQKWIEAGKFERPDHFTTAADKLVVLEDTDGDGVADTRRELAAWREMASGLVAGVEARHGEIFVTSIPSLYRVMDRDANGEAESVETMHTGFGVKTSLIGHDLHGLVWGPDGKLYFSVGDRGYHVETREGRLLEPVLGPGRGAVFRMNADASELEVFATGVRNPQELAFDDFGNLFTGDNNGDGGDSARVVYVVEGGETGWAMPYQTLAGDYIRGPWVAEGLWELQHETQPAWVLPPVAHIANGPAGFVHYPGLGLPARYANHFFLCDYAYTPGRSGIWSFALESSGAGMEMVDRHRFAWSVLPTDFDFDWRGQMYATLFDQFALTQSIVSWRHPESLEDPRVDELTALAQTRLETLDTETLVRALDFPDQRLRLRAQYALAERAATPALSTLARDTRAELVPRLHAIWGLGQIGPAAVEALISDGTAWLDAEPVELRAQLAKVAGDQEVLSFAPTLRRSLGDDSLRVRFFAAQALGALRDEAAIGPLFDVLRENADRDVFLRHAAVWALHRIGRLDEVWAYRADPSRSVRLAVLLVLRHAADARIRHFLGDEDPLLIVEAARAIYDLPIDAAMPALALLAANLSPALEDDRQTSQALHRRVIGANVRLRSTAGAEALARYIADDAQLMSLRTLALESLDSYLEPPVRDLTSGFYRPLRPAPSELLAGVFRVHGRALVDSDLGARAMEIANRIGELPLTDEELGERASGARADTDRVAALRALAARAARQPLEIDGGQAAREALASTSPAVRMAGRDLLLALDREDGLAMLIEAAMDGPSLEERQHGWRQLGAIDSEPAREAIATGLDRWRSETLDSGAALELFEAAISQGGELARLGSAELEAPASGGVEEMVAARRWALVGGDAAAGREVFQTVGDCQRCHGAGTAGSAGGHGGGVGPSLSGVRERGAEYVLASMLAPSAEMAEGFATVRVTRRDGTSVIGTIVGQGDSTQGVKLDVGEKVIEIPAEDIAERTTAVSGMPPMGLGLEARALRDLVAYVMTLE